MKKILILALLLISAATFGQLTLINVGTSANDKTGDPLRTAFQKTNLAITQVNTNTANIALKAPLLNASFTELTKINSLKVGTVKTGAHIVQLDSITSDGTNIYFYSGALILTAVPGTGSAAWGTITGTLADQTDLQSILNLKVGYPGAGIPLSTGIAWGSSITDNSTNWNTAYTDRLKWDGGATGLVAATGRTSLGATTVGNAFFLMPNPSAITFPRINADNTITVRSASNLKADLGATLVGDALFTLASPSAITFLRINADNTVASLSAANFKTALSLAASDVGLGNVTNESKATMFTNPTFTTGITTPAITLVATPITSTAPQLNYLNTTTGTSSLDDALHFDSDIDSLITKSEARSISGSATSKMQFIVDTTELAPIAGDSVFIQDAFKERHIEVYRGIGGGKMYKQYRNLTGSLQYFHDGYRFEKSTGTIIFKPVFATNEHVAIEVTDSTKWTVLIPTLTLCDEYQAVYNALDIKPSADTARAQNAFVEYLKTHGTPSYWSRADLIYVFAQRTEAGAKLDWKDPDGAFNCTDGSGSTTWTKYQGITGDGATDYWGTGWIPDPNAVNFTNISGTLMVYVRTNISEGACVVGAGATSHISITPRSAVGNFKAFAINNTEFYAAVANSQGLFVVTRRGTNDAEIYRNATSIATNATAGGVLPGTNELTILRYLTEFSNQQVAGVFVFNGITDAEEIEINTGIEILMDAMGAGVE